MRTLLIHGARSTLQFASQREDRRNQWAAAVSERRGRNIAAVAVANRNARTAWALIAGESAFDANHLGKAA